jgi:hypothetical protein
LHIKLARVVRNNTKGNGLLAEEDITRLSYIWPGLNLTEIVFACYSSTAVAAIKESYRMETKVFTGDDKLLIDAGKVLVRILVVPATFSALGKMKII